MRVAVRMHLEPCFLHRWGDHQRQHRRSYGESTVFIFLFDHLKGGLDLVANRQVAI